jgi:hypothetical protein
MPLTPATSPRFGARRPANTDDFNIERDVTGPIDALDLAAKFTSSLSTARPASPVVDQYNWSTDTDVLERWNGSAWERPTPKPHATSHQDGGTDALTVREAMMATGVLGMAKGALRAYRNAALSIASGSAVPMDTEDFDVSNWHNVATGYTPSIAGYYLFTWNVYSNAILTADVSWQSFLRKNGAEEALAMTGFQRGTAAQPASGGACVAQANGTTDAFTVGLYQSTGAAAAVMTGRSRTWLTAQLIGRT